MGEAHKSKPLRANRVGWLVAVVVVLLLLGLSCAAWWSGRAVTTTKVKAALAKEPSNRADFIDQMGMLADSGAQTTAEYQHQLWLEVLLDQPEIRREHNWYIGRGGETQVTAFFFITTVDSVWDYPPDPSLVHETEARQFCVFVNRNSELLGWVELTAVATMPQVNEWVRARMPYEK